MEGAVRPVPFESASTSPFSITSSPSPATIALRSSSIALALASLPVTFTSLPSENNFAVAEPLWIGKTEPVAVDRRGDAGCRTEGDDELLTTEADSIAGSPSSEDRLFAGKCFILTLLLEVTGFVRLSLFCFANSLKEGMLIGSSGIANISNASSSSASECKFFGESPPITSGDRSVAEGTPVVVVVEDDDDDEEEEEEENVNDSSNASAALVVGSSTRGKRVPSAAVAKSVAGTASGLASAVDVVASFEPPRFGSVLPSSLITMFSKYFSSRTRRYSASSWLASSRASILQSA